MGKEIKKIAISTGGGDAPGLNAVIRAAVLSALNRGWECVGIRDGFHGIMQPEHYPDGGYLNLTAKSVRGITPMGGTILGAANRNSPLKYPMPDANGKIVEVDRSDELIKRLRDLGIDALISIGGDGSLAISSVLQQKGFPVIAVPKTIDNDLEHTNFTFGFDTAVSFATECLDRLHTTAHSHQRVMVVEVMGRYAGWIALHAGIAGGADVILVPEIPYDINKVAEKVLSREASGRRFSVVIIAEGAHPINGKISIISKESGRAERLGGVGEKVAGEIQKLTGKETRVVVLGHLLRGGSPTNFDRLLSLRFGAAAVRGLAEGKSGVMVALDSPDVVYVPISEVVGKMKKVPVHGDTVMTARDLGLSFGD